MFLVVFPVFCNIEITRHDLNVGLQLEDGSVFVVHGILTAQYY